MIVGFQGGSTPNPRNHPHRGGEGAGLQACTIYMYILYIYICTAQGGGGSFKNRKPIGEIGCCESRMAERIH